MAGFNDSNARVQWAASQALGQMCTDLAPDIQEQHCDTIANAFLHVLSDFSKPRVQAHSCAAIVNFCDRWSPGGGGFGLGYSKARVVWGFWEWAVRVVLVQLQATA